MKVGGWVGGGVAVVGVCGGSCGDVCVCVCVCGGGGGAPSKLVPKGIAERGTNALVTTTCLLSHSEHHGPSCWW
jgi:hypothetical protein